MFGCIVATVATATKSKPRAKRAKKTSAAEGPDGRRRIRRLIERFGEPLFSLSHGEMHISVFLIDPLGTGLVLVRKSTKDLKDAASLLAQADAQLDVLARLGKSPSLLIAAEGTSGRLPLEARPDITLLRASLVLPSLGDILADPTEFQGQQRKDLKKFLARSSGSVEFVSWFATDRMARDLVGGLQLYRSLEEAKVDLYLTDQHPSRPVNWEENGIQLLIETYNAQREHERINSRGKNGRIQKLKNKRLARNHAPAGFTVDADDCPIENPKRRVWKAIERVIDLAMSDGEEGSSNQISATIKKEFKDLDIKWTPQTVLNIIRNSAYVDGVLRFEDEDRKEHEFDPIKLSWPIPEHKWKVANRVTDNRKGDTLRIRVAQFLTAGTPVVCAQCLEHFESLEDVPVWTGRKHRGAYVIRQRNASGRKGCACYGKRPPQREFELAVKHLLLEGAEECPGPAAVTEAERQALTDRIAELELKLPAASSEFCDAVLGKDMSLKESAQLADRVYWPVQNELEACKRRQTAIAAIEKYPLASSLPASRDHGLRALRELLRNEPWEDNVYYRILASTLVQRVVSLIIIHWEGDEWELELVGQPTIAGNPGIYPLQQIGDLLWEFEAARAIELREKNGSGAGVGDVEPQGHTGPQGMPRGSVCPPAQTPVGRPKRAAPSGPGSIVVGPPAWRKRAGSPVSL